MSQAFISALDTHHLGRSHVIAAHLLHGDAPALLDPGPTSTLATVEACLAEHGLTLGDLQAIVLTHIHLDHAGASGTIIARHPHIRLYVHERGAPHMINPERLMNSATQLYGSLMERLWGAMVPVPSEQVTVLRGGETIAIGERRLQVFDSPGHANHHLCYLDETSGTAFVGDTCGVRLPGYAAVRPATPPPDINLEAWAASMQMLEELRPSALALTHFGIFHDVERHINEHRERLLAWAEVVRAGLNDGLDEQTIAARVQTQAIADLAADNAETVAIYQQASPPEQSTAGLLRYWRKKS